MPEYEVLEGDLLAGFEQTVEQTAGLMFLVVTAMQNIDAATHPSVLTRELLLYLAEAGQEIAVEFERLHATEQIRNLPSTE